MRNSKIIAVVVAICFSYILFIPLTSYSVPNRMSKEFRNLLNEANRLYIKPKGWNLSEMERKAPWALASIIGHSLRQQWYHVQRKSSLQGSFTRLKNETRSYFNYVARMSGYRDSRGNAMSGEDLWQVALDYMRGGFDRDVWQKFGVRVGSMACVLDSRKPPLYSDSRTPSGRIQFGDDEDSINLLGQKLDKPSDQGIKPSDRKFNPDIIVGTWEYENKTSPGKVYDRFRINITKVGPNLYHGKYIWTNNLKQIQYHYGASLNEVWLKIKYSGHNSGVAKVPLFVGQRKKCVDFRDKGCMRTSWANIECLYFPSSDSFAVFGLGGHYYKRAG